MMIEGLVGMLRPNAILTPLSGVPCRYRLVVDESLALGVLGENGRGACEHWGLRPGDAEIVSASIGACLCHLFTCIFP